jgi:hypothetical protein
MATQQTSFRNPKSLVTTTLAALSFVILCQDMDKALSQLSPILTCASTHLLGLLPTVVLTAARALPVQACDNSSVFQHLASILASSWPLLCAMVGGA